MLQGRPTTVHSLTRRQGAALPRTIGSRRVISTSSRFAVVSRAGKVTKISQEELEVAIAERTTHIVVDFFATWCGPCVLLATELEKVAEELGDEVRIVKIDVDQNEKLASELQIMGLPTMVFIPKEGGKPALRTEGLLPSSQIIDIVREL